MAIEAGQTAPDFTLNDQNNNPVTLSELKGKKYYSISTHALQRLGVQSKLKDFVILKLN